LSLLKHHNFLNIDISQGSVATRLGCGGVFKYDFVTNFLLSLSVKEFRKSVNIWRSYGQEYSVLFFWTHSVYSWIHGFLVVVCVFVPLSPLSDYVSDLCVCLCVRAWRLV